MFGGPLLWAIAAGVAVTAFAGTYWKGYTVGRDGVQRAWNVDKAERAAAEATARESERLRAHAAALGYEQVRAARQVRSVTVNKEFSHALEASPDWGGTAVPPGVRLAIAAAGQAFAASGVDAAVRIPAAGSADERATGPGLRIGAGRIGGLFGPASGAR